MNIIKPLWVQEEKLYPYFSFMCPFTNLSYKLLNSYDNIDTSLDSLVVFVLKNMMYSVYIWEPGGFRQLRYAFGSVHYPRVLGLSPTSGSPLRRESASPSTPLHCSWSLFHPLSLSNKYIESFKKKTMYFNHLGNCVFLVSIC